MKKTAVLIVVLCYLVSVSGVAWSNFYCCGKLKETAFFTSNKLPGSFKVCKGNKIPGCCETKTFFSKVKDNHSASVSTDVKASCTDVPLFIAETSFQNTNTSLVSLSFRAPPLISTQPIYLSACIFRI